MTKERQTSVVCQICKQEKRLSEVIPAELVREPVAGTIRQTHPDWSSRGFICLSDLNGFRDK